MAVENWNPNPNFPPENYNVLDRRVEQHSEHGRTEYIWLAGVQPHLGKVINGQTGTETFVEVYIDGDYKRFRRNFHDLSQDHPLYDSSEVQPNVIQIFPRLDALENPAA